MKVKIPYHGLRAVIIAAVLSAACISLSHSAESPTGNLRLTLSAQANIVRQGDLVRCLLVLDGDLVRDIPKDTKDVVIPGFDSPFGSSSPFAGHLNFLNTFRYDFNLKPSEVGSMRVGPYRVRFAGEDLVSNDIKITVLPPHDVGRGLTVNFNRSSVQVGEPVEMLVELWSASQPSVPSRTTPYRETAEARIHSARAMQSVRLAPQSAFAVQPLGGGDTMGRGLDVSQERYQLTPLKPGRFSFTEKDFMDLPPGTKVKSQTLEVK